MTLPLEGYRVVDLGQVWAGTLLSHFLADMGAEVIRVESQAGSDDLRNYAKDPSEIRQMLDANYLWRNRTYVSLNFNKPRAIELVKDIVARSDVLIENFTPRVLQKFGLTYESLCQVKPDLIMISMSAGGQYGPYRDLVGYGPSINSISGVDSLVGYAGDDKLMTNAWDADPGVGVMGAFAVLAALHYKESSGEGQYIDLSFYEALACLEGEAIMDYRMNGRVAAPEGNRHRTMAPHGTYPCSGDDQWVSIAVDGQDEWQAFCQAIGEPPWTCDERFADVSGRLTHADLLDELVATWTSGRDKYEAMHHLQSYGVNATPVATLQDVYLDPHDQFRRTNVKVLDQNLDPSTIIYGLPWHLSETPGSVRRVVQPIGADNHRYFCGELGLSEREFEELVATQVIY